MCPICRFEHIDKDMQQCPQCDADLTCFRVLDALPIQAEHSDQPRSDLSQPPVDAGPRQIAAPDIEPVLAAASQAPPSMPPPAASGRWIACVIGLGVGVLITFGVVWIGLPLAGRFPFAATEKPAPGQPVVDALAQFSARLEGRYQAQDKLLTQVVRKIEQTEQKLISLESMIKNMPTAQPPLVAATTDAVAGETQTVASVASPLPSITYTVVRGDSLWSISDRFYGDGSYYPIILLHNPDLSVQNILPGVTLTIPGDADWAKATYPTITQRAGGRLYLLYTVQPGDTPSTLAARFCPNRRDSADPLICLGSETVIAPGRTVRIRLE